MSILSIDQVVSLSMLNDPEYAVRMLDHSIPSTMRKIVQAAADQGEEVDWSTFSLTVDPDDPPFPGTATIRTITRTR
jgi:hypothetical protein